MKKIIFWLAIILILAVALGAFGNVSDAIKPNDTSDTVIDTDEGGGGTVAPNTESSETTEGVSYLYTYHIDVYKKGTTTLISDFEIESNSETATLSYSGNLLTFKSADAEHTVSYTSMKSIDSISVTTVSPGTTAVYITYTATSSGGSTTSCSHSYVTTTAATCTTAGVKTCSLCGALQSIAATGHSWDTNDMDCQQYGICFYCEVQSTTVKGSIHPDGDNDGFCDLCNKEL